jgi:HEAT repeat protein
MGGQPISDRQFRRGLQSKDAAVRYWTGTAALAIDEPSEAMLSGLEAALADEAASVRIVAAGALARHGKASTALPLLVKELRGQDVNAVLLAARLLEELGDIARPARPDMQAILKKAEDSGSQHPNWMFVEFALAEALERLGDR